jgi:RHS repeat-associated core domain
VYMQARYYDAEVGRFLSVDPVGVKAGDGFSFNRYSYANGNPIMRIDPDGRENIYGVIARFANNVKKPYCC